MARLLRELAERRVLQKKTSELLGLYKMSWAFSLAGGADALFGHLARHTAEMLKAERGLRAALRRASARQLVAQAPGFGFTREQVQRIRYPADGEARLALELPQQRPAALEQRAGGHAPAAGAGAGSCSRAR